MHFLFYSNRFIDWTNKILLSINIVIVGFTCPLIFYPLNVLTFTLIALWLYFFRLKIASIIVLMPALYINFDHYFHPLYNCG